MWFKKKLPIEKTIEGFPCIEVFFNNMPIRFILDTGGMDNIISELFVNEFNIVQEPSNINLKGIGNSVLNPMKTTFDIYVCETLYKGNYLVRHDSSFLYPVAGILGLPFLDSMVEKIEWKKRQLVLRQGGPRRIPPSFVWSYSRASRYRLPFLLHSRLQK